MSKAFQAVWKVVDLYGSDAGYLERELNQLSAAGFEIVKIMDILDNALNSTCNSQGQLSTLNAHTNRRTQIIARKWVTE